MKSLADIRKDLKDIRYYSARKDFFQRASANVGISEIMQIVEMYNNAICTAPARLYDVYVSLYIENNTQESLSEKMCYSTEYISKLNKQLVRFLQKKLDDKKEETA